MRAGQQPRVLGIAGSPRRSGNSARLLDECLASAEAAGAVAEKIFVAAYDISPCTGCGACTHTGECVITDDMATLRARLDAAHALVVASPVYFASVPATLKALYDRLQPYWAQRYVLGLPTPPARPAALLIVRGGGDPYGHECASQPTRSALSVLGVEVVEELVVEGPDGPGDIERYPDALADAHRIGAVLVEAAESFR